MTGRESEDAWRRKLTPEQYYVCRQGGTEPPFSGRLLQETRTGVFRCAGCGAVLFDSATKFDSGSGWPSFGAPADPERVRELEDTSHGMRRIEVRCAACDCHLGHVFPDGPRPTGLRYCINSLALTFTPAE